MISFRLSLDEYRMLRDECTARGVRSVSELARAAVRRLASSPAGPAATLNDDVCDLRERLRLLTIELERISKQVDVEKASGQGSS